MLAEWNSTIVEDTLSLDLSDSQIHTLPSSLQHLTRLQSLNLRRNRLEHVPKWLGHLEELREFDISKNPVRSLPKNIRTLRIDDEQWCNLQTELLSIQSLRHLDLQDCVIKHLSWTIQNLSELRTLIIAKNIPPPRRDTLSTSQLIKRQQGDHFSTWIQPMTLTREQLDNLVTLLKS